MSGLIYVKPDILFDIIRIKRGTGTDFAVHSW